MAQLEHINQVDSLRVADHSPQLFNATISNSNADYFLACGNKGGAHGLPELRITGLNDQTNPFAQPAESNSWKDSLKRILGGGDSVEDQLRKKVFDRAWSEMTEDEKKQYKKEQREMDEAQIKVGICISPPAEGEMHKKIDTMLHDTEKQITAAAREHMTDGERAAADKGLSQYDKDYHSEHGLASPRIPDVVQDYYKRIAWQANDPNLKIESFKDVKS